MSTNTSFTKQTAGLGEVPRDGLLLLRSRFFSKGTAFTDEERALLGLEGVLPPQVETIHEQLVRVWHQFNRFTEPINKYQLLRSIQSSNNTLYYALILRHLTEILPIIYTPTVGEACQKFGNLYMREHGIYIPSGLSMGKIPQILKNARRDNIDVIVVTDGSRILGLGDLGTNGMGISIGKCSLYVAGAGVHPRRVLPVVVDAGTNNTDLRNDPLYLGQRIPRIDDKTFYSVMDDFMASVSKTWPKAVVQFEDFSNNHCFEMLARYREKYRCFNDDIQGTGAVVSAGFFNAIKLSKIDAVDHKILVFGAGSAAVGVVEAIAALIAFKTGVPQDTILANVYLVDTKGLVTATRGDELASHKVKFARKDVSKEEHATMGKDLLSIVKFVKPTALIGLGASGPVFTQEIIKFIASYCARPIVFPLSNPTSKSEIEPANAYAWTNGQAIVASGSPYMASNIAGKMLKPSQGNNMYIFPGIGLGSSLAQPSTISDACMVRAAAALVDMTTDRMLNEEGQLYPPLTSIREVSKHVAAAVILQAQEEGVGGADLPKDAASLIKFAGDSMWEPEYIDYTARDSA